jgi:hypothetical protein
MSRATTGCIAFFVCIFAVTHVVDAAILYSASLRNGDYGGGFQVGTYLVSSPWNRSGSLGGNLGTLGVVDSSAGVTFTTPNDVINFSLGADGKDQAAFRTHGTVSVHFKADLSAFVTGQPFVDNYGFDQFNSGQATFGTAMSRHTGLDGFANTADDKVELSWNTWHSGVWYNHVDTTNDEVLLDFDQWHHLGLTWGGPTNHFEMWVDGVLVASDNLPGSFSAWGGSNGAYNFALGEIHERMYGNSSPSGVMFADLEVWDEYRAMGNTQSPVPEPTTLMIWGTLGGLGLVAARRRKRVA